MYTRHTQTRTRVSEFLKKPATCLDGADQGCAQDVVNTPCDGLHGPCCCLLPADLCQRSIQKQPWLHEAGCIRGDIGDALPMLNEENFFHLR